MELREANFNIYIYIEISGEQLFLFLSKRILSLFQNTHIHCDTSFDRIDARRPSHIFKYSFPCFFAEQTGSGSNSSSSSSSSSSSI